MKSIGKWLFLIGLLIAVVVSFVPSLASASWLSLILALVGIVVGVIYFDTKDLVHMGIRFLVLSVVATALDAVPGVGKYLTGVFQAAVAFLAPVLLTMLVVFFVQKYFMGKEE